MKNTETGPAVPSCIYTIPHGFDDLNSVFLGEQKLHIATDHIQIVTRVVTVSERKTEKTVIFLHTVLRRSAKLVKIGRPL